ILLARREAGEHLVECAERLALEPGALRRACDPQRRGDAVHLDVMETRLCEQFADTGRAERAGKPGRRRRQLRSPADDPDRHREEPVAVGLGEHDRPDATAGPQRDARPGESPRLAGKYMIPSLEMTASNVPASTS